MDRHRFDNFARTLAGTHSRRGALVILGSLLAAPLLDDERADAKKKKKKVTVCHNGKTVKVAKKKRDQFLLVGATLGACASAPPPPPPTSPPPPDPTCTDGSKSGDETGVDCGGSCPRCVNGQPCDSRADCASALCRTEAGSGGKYCVACQAGVECGEDTSLTCQCLEPKGGGAKFCASLGSTAAPCDEVACPQGSICTLTLIGDRCMAPCGFADPA